MLSVSLSPTVITLSGFHCNSWCCSGIWVWNLNSIFNKYKNKSQPIHFFLHQWKMVVWSKVSFWWFQDEKQIKAHYTSKIFSISILKCHFLMDRKDSSFFPVSLKVIVWSDFSLTLGVDGFLNILWKYNHFLTIELYCYISPWKRLKSIVYSNIVTFNPNVLSLIMQCNLN
jgi:hypothetical protein